MSKHVNKPVPSIIVYERGGKTAESGCIDIINRFEVGATTAKDALAIMSRLYGNARRFYVPNEQVKINAKPTYYLYGRRPNRNDIYTYVGFPTKLTRTRSRQRRTSLPHGDHLIPRGTVAKF